MKKILFLFLITMSLVAFTPKATNESRCVSIKSASLSVDATSAPNGYQYSFSAVVTPSKASSPKAYAFKRNGEIIEEGVFSGGNLWFTYTENEVGTHEYQLEAVNCGGGVESNTLSIWSF